MADSFKSYFTFSKANRKIFLAAVIYTLITILLPFIASKLLTNLSPEKPMDSLTEYMSLLPTSNLLPYIFDVLLVLFVGRPLFTGIVKFTYDVLKDDETGILRITDFFRSARKYFGAVMIMVISSLFIFSVPALPLFIKINMSTGVWYYLIEIIWMMIASVLLFLSAYIYAFSAEKGVMNAVLSSFRLSKGYRLKIFMVMMIIFSVYILISFVCNYLLTKSPENILIIILYTVLFSVYYYFYFRSLTKFAEKIISDNDKEVREINEIKKTIGQ